MKTNGISLVGLSRDSNLWLGKEELAQSNLTLEEIKVQYYLYTNRAISTIRQHLVWIYWKRINMGRKKEQYFPRVTYWDRWNVRYQEEQRRKVNDNV